MEVKIDIDDLTQLNSAETLKKMYLNKLLRIKDLFKTPPTDSDGTTYKAIYEEVKTIF